LIFVEGGKPENPEKNPRSKDENQQQTQPTYDTGSRIRTRATLVGGERDHHCAIPAPKTDAHKTDVNCKEYSILYNKFGNPQKHCLHSPLFLFTGKASETSPDYYRICCAFPSI